MAEKLSKRNRKIIGIRIKPNEGLWIVYQLRLKGISQTEMAARLGLSLKTVNRILRGKGQRMPFIRRWVIPPLNP